MTHICNTKDTDPDQVPHVRSLVLAHWPCDKSPSGPHLLSHHDPRPVCVHFAILVLAPGFGVLPTLLKVLGSVCQEQTGKEKAYVH